MSLRLARRLLACALLVLLAVHALGKQRAVMLPEMLWACHVASLLVAVGVLVSWQRPIAIGFLFHLGIGVPALALEILATHEIGWVSLALHVLTPLTGWLSVQRLASAAVLETWIFYLAMQAAGLLAPEALNVNVAHRPWTSLPWEIGGWTSRLMNAAGALLFLLGAFAIARRFSRLKRA